MRTRRVRAAPQAPQADFLSAPKGKARPRAAAIPPSPPGGMRTRRVRAAPQAPQADSCQPRRARPVRGPRQSRPFQTSSRHNLKNRAVVRRTAGATPTPTSASRARPAPVAPWLAMSNALDAATRFPSPCRRPPSVFTALRRDAAGLCHRTCGAKFCAKPSGSSPAQP
jgi:hypothetical protein